MNYDYLLCFLHFRTLHSWHLFSFFLLNSLNTHHKAELPQQQHSLRPWQLQLTASFAFYMQWKQKQNDAQTSAQCKIERESVRATRAQESATRSADAREAACLCYVFLLLLFRLSPLSYRAAFVVVHAARVKCNLSAHGEGEYDSAAGRTITLCAADSDVGVTEQQQQQSNNVGCWRAVDVAAGVAIAL